MLPSLNAILKERITLSDDATLFRIAFKEGEVPPFKPGQFTILGLPGSHRRFPFAAPEKHLHDSNKYILRAYSISSSPLNKEFMEFYITLVKEGSLTPRLWALQENDSLWLSPKISGFFTLDPVPEDKNVIFIGTGTGIAPYYSMLLTFLNSTKRRYALFHGVRHFQDLGYKQECEEMEKKHSHFTYHPILSRSQNDPTPWAGLKGRVQDLWKTNPLEKTWGTKPNPENTHIFLCGNPQMIEDMLVLLAAEGFTEHKRTAPGQVHVERYW